MSNAAYLLRYAFRNILRKPMLSGSIVASVGISIGALLCILTLCNLLIVQPLPYKNADALYVVTNEFMDKDGEVKGEAYTYPGVLYLDKEQTAFSEAATLYYSDDVITSEPDQPAVKSTYASSDWFGLLQVLFAGTAVIPVLASAAESDQMLHSSTAACPMPDMAYAVLIPPSVTQSACRPLLEFRHQGHTAEAGLG